MNAIVKCRGRQTGEPLHYSGPNIKFEIRAAGFGFIGPYDIIPFKYFYGSGVGRNRI